MGGSADSGGVLTSYKILTHDYRPPLQGGEPVWDGETLPWAMLP